MRTIRSSTQTWRPSRFWVAFDMFALPVMLAGSYAERSSWWSLFWAALAIGTIYELVEWVEWLVRRDPS